jgi:PRTRC genetic system protein E
MFQTIEPLVRSAGKLALSLKMDGDRMVVVVMPQGDSKEAVLRQPLILTATPAELDEGFVAAVQSYSSAHSSLVEQVAATTAILQAAETTQVNKAQNTLAKGGKGSGKPKPAASEGEEGDDEDGEESGASQDTAPASSQPADAETQKPAGTDLFALIS